MNRTGVDMVSMCGTGLQAEWILASIVRDIKSYIFKTIPYQEQKVMEFFLSRELFAIYEVIEIICKVVIVGINTGSFINSYKTGSVKLDKVIPILECDIQETMMKYKNIYSVKIIPKHLIHLDY
jgi:hypothetical protein